VEISVVRIASTFHTYILKVFEERAQAKISPTAMACIDSVLKHFFAQILKETGILFSSHKRGMKDGHLFIFWFK